MLHKSASHKKKGEIDQTFKKEFASEKINSLKKTFFEIGKGPR
jgi:hypothetical protein